MIKNRKTVYLVLFFLLLISYIVLKESALPILIVGYLFILSMFIFNDMKKDLFSLSSLFLIHYSIYLLNIPIKQLKDSYSVRWYILAMDRSLGTKIMLVCGLVTLMAFIFGSNIEPKKRFDFSFIKKKKIYCDIKNFFLSFICKYHRILNIRVFAYFLTFVGTIFFLIGIHKMGGLTYLFSKYVWNSEKVAEVGIMTTGIQIAYAGIIISFYIFLNEKKFSIKNILKWPIPYVFIFLSGIKFIQGGRIQVLMACISLVLIFNYEYRKIKLKHILILGVIGVMLLGYIGYYRDYKTLIPSDFKTMIKYMMGGSGGLEYFLNSYTNFTTMHVINSTKISYLWGASILDGFIFLIPRFLLPNKGDMLFITKKVNELSAIEIISPVGGLNLAAQNLINGGVVFTALFMFIIGMLFMKLRSYSYKSINGTLLYSLIVPYLIVSFIRNPMYFTIKEIIQFCIVPYIIFLILKAGEHYKEKKCI
ncbi:O-antigen polymerase [Clostridium nigeriense]|uniref:O-antigen polymerase n=1 Tax=Clostridium nigeriense TaxID=1805470 RepID=UPI00083488A3|nr:O-antigen polymerase [Clostridium nigeriense]